MDLAQRDRLLENLQKKSSEINIEMVQFGRIFEQKGGNKFMASARKQYDHYTREQIGEQIGGKQETLEAMHALVDYLDRQIETSDYPHLKTRAIGGRRRVLTQITEYSNPFSRKSRQNIKK